MTKREREREHEKSGQLFVSMVRSMLKIESSYRRDAYIRVRTRVYVYDPYDGPIKKPLRTGNFRVAFLLSRINW